MQIEEKMEVFRKFTIDVAKEESERQLAEYEETCNREVETFRHNKLEELEHKIRSEERNIRRQMNSRVSGEMLRQKRSLDECKSRWKAKLFEEVKTLLAEYQKTEEYRKYLIAKIKMARDMAGEEDVIIYIAPSDADKKTDLEGWTGAELVVSNIDFGGGIRAVIHARNILIDESFVTKLEQEEVYL